MKSGIKSFVVGFLFGAVAGIGSQYAGVTPKAGILQDVAPVTTMSDVAPVNTNQVPAVVFFTKMCKCGFSMNHDNHLSNTHAGHSE